VVAPGASIYSTLINGGYGYKSGVAMASPLVAGLAGLVFSLANDSNGRLNDEVGSQIETICDNVGINVAFGCINAYRAVPGDSSTPIPTPTPSPTPTPTPTPSRKYTVPLFRQAHNLVRIKMSSPKSHSALAINCL
jgi:subtilisin family serine protease